LRGPNRVGVQEKIDAKCRKIAELSASTLRVEADFVMKLASIQYRLYCGNGYKIVFVTGEVIRVLGGRITAADMEESRFL